MTKRTLSLRKETLTALDDAELLVVVGAQVSQLCATDPCITPYSGLQCIVASGRYCS